MFASDMVLQRDKPVRIWGWADPADQITVAFGDQRSSATTDAHGRWMIEFPPLPACREGRQLRIVSTRDREAIVLENVVVGDVWLCSGQSNMEWPLSKTWNGEQEAQAAQRPLLRHFKIPRATAAQPLEQLSGQWRVCGPETAGSFTAVGYYFAKKIQEHLDVPVGLINSSHGGSRIEPWIAPVGFAMVPAADRGDAVNPVQQPSRLFNAMIHPLIPFAIRGVLWYQGESNRTEGISYLHKKRALIRGWRERWGEELIFLFVQLPNSGQPVDQPPVTDSLAWFRQVQARCLEIPNTAMAVTIDIGEATGHPRNKLDVGRRLALCALATEYQRTDVIWSGPVYRRHAIEQNRIRIWFEHLGSGLMIGEKEKLSPTRQMPNGTLRGFAVSGKDQKWYWADASIDGYTVVVSSAEVARPVAVRYAFSANSATANLYNREGLPARPFRTDDW